jgi:outer membrane protein assembly factor BamB
MSGGTEHSREDSYKSVVRDKLTMKTTLLMILGTCALETHLLAAGAWTQFRGSNHDSVSTENIRLNWAQEAPKIVWKVPLPAGLSSFSVDNGRLFTMGRRLVSGRDTELCLGLDANTGRELWASQVGRTGYPDGGVGNDDGPRSTPAVDGEQVFAFGSYMNLVCLNATNGTELWRRNLETEYQARIIAWQNAASPVVLGDLVIVNGNGRAGEHLLAFRKSDGTLVWKTGTDGLTHASPVSAVIAGVPQVVFFAQTGLVSVAPETGNVLWRYAIQYNGVSVAASPIVAGDTVYASRAYAPGAGAAVVRITNNSGSLAATKIWEKSNVVSLMNHWATPVYYNGHYYGIYGQDSLNLRCIDAATGDSKWFKSGVGYGSVTRVKDKLVVLTATGDIWLAEANSEAYTELAVIKPLRGKCWNNPAISNGRIYVRSTLEAVALDVSVANTAVPLSVEMARSNTGELTLQVATQDGTPLESQRAQGISIYASSALGAATTWTKVAGSTVLSSGKLLLENPEGGATAAQRYFRTEEMVTP